MGSLGVFLSFLLSSVSSSYSFFNVNTALDSCLQYGRENTYYWFSFMHVKLNIFELYFYTHKIILFKSAS